MKKQMSLLKYRYEKAKDSLYSKNQFIVVNGNPVDGYRFVGPFNHFDDALNKKGDGYVAELSKEDCNE
jgi:hypothetical protein